MDPVDQQQQIADGVGQLAQTALSPTTEAAPEPQPQAENPDDIMAEINGGQQQNAAPGVDEGQQIRDEMARNSAGKSTMQQLGEGLQRLPSTLWDSLKEESSTARAALGGAVESGFQTKDFLTGGAPAEADKSDLRKSVEGEVNDLSQQSTFDGFAAGMGQFTAGMIGVGKLGEAARLIGWVGRGAESLEAMKYGKTALESTKAAIAGAIAFDPHQENIMNLVQGTALQNPLSSALASKPDDTETIGRLKNALSSIGVDAVVQGAFLGGIKIFRYLNHGDTAGASKAVSSFEAEQKANLAQEQQSNAGQQPTPSPTSPAGGTPEAVPPGPQGGLSEVPPSGGPGVQPDGLPAGSNPADGGSTPAITKRSGAPLEADNANEPASPVGTPSGPLGTGREGAPEVGPKVGEGPAPEPANMNLEGAGQPMASPLNIRKSPAISFADENTKAVMEGTNADMDALDKYGNWDNATAQGYTFGQGEGVPFHKLTTPAELDNMMARAVDESEAKLDNLKGGAVMTDARVAKTVKYYAEVTGQDEQTALGLIQQAGAEAPKMVAKMEAGYVLAQKAFMQAFALNERYRIGDFSGFNSLDDMFKEVQHRLAVATSYYGSARSITANSARAVRRMQKQFMFDANAYADVAPKNLSDVLHSSGGKPTAIRTIVSPSWRSQALDFLQMMRINSLVSGPSTQAINMLTTAYMTMARPLERTIGSLPGASSVLGRVAAGVDGVLGGGNGGYRGALAGQRLGVMSRAIRQYTYMGTSLWDGFQAGVKAALANDSGLAPHSVEMYGSPVKQPNGDYLLRNPAPGAQPVGPGNGPFFKPATSIGNITYNALSAPGLLLSVPTRLLGGADEMFKFITYRSKVLANAASEAHLQVAGKGLSQVDAQAQMKAYIQQRVSNAFGPNGEALDKAALLEAQTATFTQELGEGTLGRAVQTLTQNFPPARLVVPFIKTPTNVIRMGWKMTPGLNLLQGEYRQMLMGAMGPEAQAQATGQWMMGTLFMGLGGYLASQGMITGGGPSDPKARQGLQDAGWKPYAFRHVDAEGKPHFISFGRFDPAAIPLGMIADIHDALHYTEWDGTDEGMNPAIEAALGAVAVSMAKQFSSRSYLMGVQQSLEALTDPDKGMSNLAGNMAGSFVPYSAAMRQTMGDDYAHDARSVVDKALMSVPGYAKSVPVRYNWLGEPAINRTGAGSVFSTEGTGTVVDNEMVRLAMQTGTFLSRPNPVVNGVDLRNITMADGKNAYEEYQKLSGRPRPNARSLRLQIQRVMLSKAYAKAPDGDSDLEGTRLNMLAGVLNKYHDAARKQLLHDPFVSQAYKTPSMQVQDHYRELRGQPPRLATPGTGIDALGKAFGVDTSSAAAPVAPSTPQGDLSGE